MRVSILERSFQNHRTILDTRTSAHNAPVYKLRGGDIVGHSKYGPGKIVGFAGSPDGHYVQVDFSRLPSSDRRKQFNFNYAPNALQLLLTREEQKTLAQIN